MQLWAVQCTVRACTGYKSTNGELRLLCGNGDTENPEMSCDIGDVGGDGGRTKLAGARWNPLVRTARCCGADMRAGRNAHASVSSVSEFARDRRSFCETSLSTSEGAARADSSVGSGGDGEFFVSTAGRNERASRASRASRVLVHADGHVASTSEGVRGMHAEGARGMLADESCASHVLDAWRQTWG